MICKSWMILLHEGSDMHKRTKKLVVKSGHLMKI